MRGAGQLEPGAQQAAVRGPRHGRGAGRGEDRRGGPAVHGAAAGRHAAEGRHHAGEHGGRDPRRVRRAARRPGGVRRRAGRDRAARPGRVRAGAAAAGRHQHHHVPAEAGRRVRRQDLPRQGRGRADRAAGDILRRRGRGEAVQLAQLQHRVVRRVPRVPAAGRLRAHHGQPADEQRPAAVGRDGRAPGDHAVRGLRQPERFRRGQDVRAGHGRAAVRAAGARAGADIAAVRKVQTDDNRPGQERGRDADGPGRRRRRRATDEIGLTAPSTVPAGYVVNKCFFFYVSN